MTYTENLNKLKDIIVNLLCLTLLHEFAHGIAAKLLWNLDVVGLSVNGLSIAFVFESGWQPNDIVGNALILLLFPILLQLVFIGYRKLSKKYILLMLLSHSGDFMMFLTDTFAVFC